jgi:3-phosphoshikimate 1-carboxyvinyltransferase
MRQSIRAASTPIHARVTLPGSKSITNRALLLAALATGKSILSNVLMSDDTQVFAAALRRLGIAMRFDEPARVCEITGSGGNFPERVNNVWCEDAGTAARFLLAACAAVGGVYQFDGSAQLRCRPMSPLLQCLMKQGVTVTPASQLPLTMTSAGNLPGGAITIAGEQSSQFASGLLMAAPLFKNALTLTTTNVVSKPYVAMTCAMMRAFGVDVNYRDEQVITVAAPSNYHGCDYLIESDMSTASYFFAAAAVTGGRVTIPAIQPQQSLQGDSKFLDVLTRMGCVSKQNGKDFHLEGPPVLRGIEIDMGEFSDTFMTLAALACFADSPTIITNIAHTRLQESDRITAMRTNLQTLGIKVEEGYDWLKIFPGMPRAGIINSHGDHRIAMAGAILGLRREGIIIDNAQCVSKTCPEFFTMWDTLCLYQS